jgi:hypothetical protein
MTKYTSPEPTIYRSLGLDALCEKIQGRVACRILELGPVRGGNIEFWSQFSPSVYIADLRSSLPLPVTAEDPDNPVMPEPDWEQLLNLPEDRSFDVVLAWDLLNYLELPAAASLIRYLCRFCRHGTFFFALIFDQKQMPEQITVYRIVDQGRLHYDNTSSAMRTCPRHQPRALAGIMEQFRTANSFRLKNGLVEYLFVYEGNQLPSAKSAG